MQQVRVDEGRGVVITSRGRSRGYEGVVDVVESGAGVQGQPALFTSRGRRRGYERVRGYPCTFRRGGARGGRGRSQGRTVTLPPVGCRRGRGRGVAVELVDLGIAIVEGGDQGRA